MMWMKTIASMRDDWRSKQWGRPPLRQFFIYIKRVNIYIQSSVRNEIYKISNQSCIPSFRLSLTLALSDISHSNFEEGRTIIQISIFIVKNNLIPVIPYTPTSGYHGNFKESVIWSVLCV